MEPTVETATTGHITDLFEVAWHPSHSRCFDSQSTQLMLNGDDATELLPDAFVAVTTART